MAAAIGLVYGLYKFIIPGKEGLKACVVGFHFLIIESYWRD